MYIVRGVGVFIALVLVYLSSLLFKVDLRDMISITAFVLVVDLLMVRYIARAYMMQIAEQVQIDEKNKEDK